MMRPKRQWDLLLDPVCKYCTRRFIENVPRYKSHVRNHELNIKPYWYNNPKLKPKAGCVASQMRRLRLSTKNETRDEEMAFYKGGYLDRPVPQESKNVPQKKSVPYKTPRQKIGKGRKLHQCSFCGKSFRNVGHKKEHEMIHTGEKPHKCSYCHKSFISKGNKNKHEQIHREGSVRIGECKDQKMSETIPDHLNTKKETRGVTALLKGSYTDESVPQENQKVSQDKSVPYKKPRQKIGPGAKPHQCSYCGKSFRNSGHKKEHEMIHTGEKPHECSYCPKSFRTKGTKKTHERIHTEGSLRKRECTNREMSETTPVYLNNKPGEETTLLKGIYSDKSVPQELSHKKLRQKIDNGEEKPHQCSYCDKAFHSSGHKKEHEMIHTGEKLHKCSYSYCQKSFRQLRHKKYHEETHKPHQCSYCGKSFRQLGHKKEHEMIHTGEKPHECSYCQKSFGQMRHRNKHEQIHQCRYCDKSFIKSSDKRRHEMIHTGEM